MWWGSLTVPEIAPTGQVLAHFVQPLHLSSWILIVLRAVQTPAGHFLSTMWARYSSLKYFKVDNTGLGAVLPKPHKEPS